MATSPRPSAKTPARTAAKTPVPARKARIAASKARPSAGSADPTIATSDAATENKVRSAAAPETAGGVEARVPGADYVAPAVDLAHATDDPHIFDDPVTSHETLETTTEQLDMIGEFVRKFAESSLAQSRDALDGLRNSADRATVGFDQSTLAWQEAGRDLNVRTIAAMKAGTVGMFDCMVALASAKSLQEAATLYNEHIQRQASQMRESNREIVEACGDYARKTMEPFRPIV